MLTVTQALWALRQALQPFSDTAGLDAQVLLAELSGRSRAWLLAHPEAPLPSACRRPLQQALARLQDGEPLPYVLGHWEFFGLDFQVTPAVLIPRPETELLVERALSLVGNRLARVADVGTGSGCIAVALAVQRPHWQLVATDRSRAALRVAQQNLQRHGVAERVALVQTDLLMALRGPFDLICANLPYIPTADLEELAVARCEPRLALDGGPDGLQVIRRLLPQAKQRLSPAGRLLLEIEYRQEEAAGQLIRQHWPQARVAIHTDLQGHPRVLEVCVP